MPEADTDIGFGMQFLRGTGDPVVYATVGQVTDVTLPGLSRETQDATHHESEERFREFIGSLRDAGSCGFTIQFSTPSALDDLMADYRLNTAVPYRMTFPDDTGWDVRALVTSITPVAPIDGKMTCDCEFKISGKPGFLD